MADIQQSLDGVMQIPGALAAALVDTSSGMTLGTAGNGHIDIELAAAGNTEVVRAQLMTLGNLGLEDRVEDLLITLSTQIHVIRPVASPAGEGLFLYAALDKERSNLALARRNLQQIERELEV
jgi:hypothetical protein